MGFGLPMGNCHLDVLGACREEDIILSMRYYAYDEERARWGADFPDFPRLENPLNFNLTVLCNRSISIFFFFGFSIGSHLWLHSGQSKSILPPLRPTR